MTFSRWHYFNHYRIIEMALKMNISLPENHFFSPLNEMGILDKNGLLQDPQQWRIEHKPKYQIYDFGAGIQLYAYMNSIWGQVLKQLPIVDISKIWTRSEIKAIVKPGTLISCEGAFYFKHSDVTYRGRNQNVTAYRRADGIRLEFGFDAWDCTSMSAKVSYMTGCRRATSICLVASVGGSETLKISASGIAVGFDFQSMDNSGMTAFRTAMVENSSSRSISVEDSDGSDSGELDFDDSDPFI